MATTASKPATEADLWAMPDDGCRYELVDGEIRRMTPAGRPHGRTAVRLMIRLGGFVEAQRLGETYESSTGFRMPIAA
jgi:Uma2 family endonuclease